MFVFHFSILFYFLLLFYFCYYYLLLSERMSFQFAAEDLVSAVLSWGACFIIVEAGQQTSNIFVVC